MNFDKSMKRRIETKVAITPQQLGKFESLTCSDSSDSMKKSKRRVKLYDLVSNDNAGELTPYVEAWDFQKCLMEFQLDRINDFNDENVSSSQWLPESGFSSSTKEQHVFKGDSVMMLEHEPVYTLGTRSDPDFIKTQNDAQTNYVDIVRIERGGEVTYHGPGQLVVYPIVDLRGYKQDLHWYIRALEETIIVALNSVGIKNAIREDDLTGVWVNGKKIAAIGVRVRRWVTMHGLAVNIDKRSLSNFEGIVPCGLVGRNVTCVNDVLLQENLTPISIEDFVVHMKRGLEEVFQIDIVEEIP